MDFNIVLVIVIGVVILGSLALWLGRSMRLRKDKEGFVLETDAVQPEKPTEKAISVGKDLEIEDATTGDIAGIKSDTRESATDTPGKFDVLSGGKIKKSKTGDIVGIKRENNTDEEKK